MTDEERRERVIARRRVMKERDGDTSSKPIHCGADLEELFGLPPMRLLISAEAARALAEPGVR